MSDESISADLKGMANTAERLLEVKEMFDDRFNVDVTLHNAVPSVTLEMRDFGLGTAGAIYSAQKAYAGTIRGPYQDAVNVLEEFKLAVSQNFVKLAENVRASADEYASREHAGIEDLREIQRIAPSKPGKSEAKPAGGD